jgi:hypothetical protein
MAEELFCTRCGNTGHTETVYFDSLGRKHLRALAALFIHENKLVDTLERTRIELEMTREIVNRLLKAENAKG